MKVRRMMELLAAANPDADVQLCSSPSDDWQILSIYSQHMEQGKPSGADDVVWIDIKAVD